VTLWHFDCAFLFSIKAKIFAPPIKFHFFYFSRLQLVAKWMWVWVCVCGCGTASVWVPCLALCDVNRCQSHRSSPLTFSFDAILCGRGRISVLASGNNCQLAKWDSHSIIFIRDSVVTSDIHTKSIGI